MYSDPRNQHLFDRPMNTFKNLIPLIYVLLFIPAKAQTYLIYYDQITSFSGQSDTVSGSLLIDSGKGVSLYQFGKVDGATTTSKNIDEDGNMTVRAVKKVDTLGSYVRTDLSSGHQELREKALGKYFMVHDTTTINWSSLSDTIIDGRSLKRAVCKFRGRDYIVNYIPFKGISAGPWKFKGLPGLIVEAEDSTHEVRFKLKNIDSAQNHKFIEPFVIQNLLFFQTYESFRQHRNSLREQDVASLNNPTGSSRIMKITYSQVKVSYLEKD